MPPAELDLHASPLPPGLAVIEASAGTGKTYSISHLVPRLLLEGALPDLSKLLLVTFTKDAARELSDRVRRVLTRLAEPPDADELAGKSGHDIARLRERLADPAAAVRLRRALLDLDLLSVSTIHAFCQRSLQQEGALCGLPVLPEVVTDDTDHLDPIIRRHWIATLSADPVLATLAAARGWSLDAARQFINTRRRCLRPQPEPAATPYLALRADIAPLHARLADPASLAALLDFLSPVAKWNKGSTSDSVRARLTAFAALAPHDLEFWNELGELVALQEHIKNVGPQKPLRVALPEQPWFAALLELHALAAGLEWSWQHHLADLAIPELAAHLARHRLITQDGLIGALYHALHRTGDPAAAEQSARLADRLAERYHVALIDESQDTDPRQFAIFKRVFLEASPVRRLLLVGDPKQAIYGFRGADLATYLAARDSAAVRYTLSHTRRAPQPLVSVVNSLFGRPAAFLNPGMAFTPAISALDHDHRLFRAGVPCSRLEVWLVPDEDNSAYSAQARRIPAISARVTETILDLLAHGSELVKTRLATGEVVSRDPVTPASFAVLVATHAQAAGMAEALQARGIPAVINSGADVFATEEASDLHLLLNAVLEPRRTARLRRALATRLLGLDASALAALDAAPEPSAESAAGGPGWLRRFTDWQDLWQRRGLVALFTALDQPADPSDPADQGVTQRLALGPLTGERRVTNYRQLTDLLLDAARETAPRPDELVRWLGQQIARATDRSDAEERQLQLSSDRAAVQVVTMHKSKGLEYPLVFCPYLADSLKKSKGYEKLPAPPATDDALPSDTLLNLALLDAEARKLREAQLLAAQLEERLRLAYVALTRARARAWTCAYRGSGAHDLASPLDWLLRPADEIAAHPAYSSDWVRLIRDGGASRFETALRELGAEPAPAVADLTFCPPPDLTAATAYVPPAPSATAPEAAELRALPPPHVPPSWRVTSFSTLTREKHAHGTPAPFSSPPNSLPPATASQATSQSLIDNAAAPAFAVELPAPAFLAAPAGAAVGTVVHDWIQTWDFSELLPLPPAGSAIADSPIGHWSLDMGHSAVAESVGVPVLHELFSILRLIRLPGCGDAPLHALCPDAHGSEWHFHLPLAGALSAQSLADCFAEHAAPEHRAYAPQLAALSDEKFHGLLQGFIDRLARHDDAWGVIDWKTNRLGPVLADYDQPALLRCAMDSHYLLQTHLYLVALRRYLRALGLDAAPVAGAWLVFLRAIAPGSTRGVLHIDPPAAMLDALDTLFAAPSDAVPA